MAAGSWMVATRRMRPPQFGQASTSIAKARCMRAAQLQYRGVVFVAVPSRRASRGAARPADAVGSGTSRPYATTDRRERACGASTPWLMSRLTSGRGVMAARRSNNSSGSNTNCLVPSCHA